MMIEILRPIFEMLVVIPGMLLAYLPVHSYLNQDPRNLFAWLSPLLIGISVVGGSLSYALHISTAWIIFTVILLSMFIYIKTLCVSMWKSGSVFLAIVAVFACINSLSRAFNASMIAETLPTGNEMWFCFGAGLLYNLLCWICVGAVWYPATHAARDLIEDDNLPVTWKIFWVLPLVFIGLNLFMIPKYRETLYTHRVLQGYIIISLILLALLGLFYAMLLIIANSLNRNTKLQQENQFLAMQQSRYDNLKSAIEETKHARHDLRHHFTRLFAMAEDGDLEKMKIYILAAQESVPDLDMHFSDNRAVDSIIGHYCTLARREGIPFLSKIDLPDRLPVDEVDLCLVLSNLLENALEASLRIDAGKRQIIIETYMHSEHLVLIHIENAFDGNIKEKDGVFKSSKRKGNGVGIQSVRRIAEKNGGGSSFEYNDVTFTVNVMLRD